MAVTSPVPVPAVASDPASPGAAALAPASGAPSSAPTATEQPEEDSAASGGAAPRPSTPPLPAAGAGAGAAGSGPPASGVDPKVQVARIIRDFLDASASQLTYHGLLELHAQIKERELAVFFRNNHFCTLFKVWAGSRGGGGGGYLCTVTCGSGQGPPTSVAQ